MQNISICQICKEPINNFICIDCFTKDIEKWMPANLSAHFIEFNTWFLGIFKYKHQGGPVCHHIVCTKSNKNTICLYCYVNEVFQWLLEQNKPVAKHFRRLFSFGMKIEDFKDIIKAHAVPITEVENMKLEFGICDKCGEYTDELRLMDAEWLCRECAGE